MTRWYGFYYSHGENTTTGGIGCMSIDSGPSCIHTIGHLYSWGSQSDRDAWVDRGRRPNPHHWNRRIAVREDLLPMGWSAEYAIEADYAESERAVQYCDDCGGLGPIVASPRPGRLCAGCRRIDDAEMAS